ncbi:FirrV-1-A11 [Feldmannia irregularis virus a]|uniref:FirrV-1-A11 n=1 Tax=Feldmannia irregularis virus a TaxID=231992 RepID=Q6XM76_9PHYC|nr:FirrV-1-A11 [Feldmannia irregularis virus a]AAR26835.1 FirrV-1-A11 [Feldmannia irregularis virus a]
MTLLTAREILCHIAGGFLQAGSQCVVGVETTTNGIALYNLTSILPEKMPEDLMKMLGAELGMDPSHISVTVYGLCGGIAKTTHQP